MKIEVGQVWEIKGELYMIAYERPDYFMAGAARKCGESYAMIETPSVLSRQTILSGKLIFDTEGLTSAATKVAHAYTSTACLHGHHAQCRLKCKFCPALCRCDCH